MKGLAVGVGVAAAAFVTWRGAVAAITLGQKAFATATALSTGGIKAMNAAMKANVIGLIVTAIAGLVAGLTWFFTKTETGQKIWQGFMDVLSTAWTWLKDTFTPVFQWMGDVISSVWDGIKTGASWLWESVLQPIFGFIGAAWEVLSTGIQWYWENVIKRAWDTISTVISWLWNSVLQPIFGFIGNAWQALSTAIQWAWNSIIKPAWNAVATAARWLWNNVLSPVFGFIKQGWDLLSQGISNIWNNIIKPVWEAFGDTIDWVVHNIVEPAFEAVKTALSAVGDFFDTVVDGIKTVWNGLKEILAVPIRFLVETVYGKGIRPAWNAVAGFLPIDDAPEVALQFATGGAVSGPGTGTSDDIAAKLSNGEHVLTADEVNALGGQGNVYAMRGMIDSGKTFTVTPDGVYMSGDSKRDNGPAYPVLAFAEGGAVEKPAWETALERAHAWASSVNGRPYLTGSQWDAGGDCSGYMSAIASVAVGAEPNAGHWATPAFPAAQGGTIHAGNQVWEPGLGQGLSIGMTGGPQSGGAMGHTAGTLSSAGSYGSVNVESGGSHGNVAYGGPAVGADDGQWKSGNYHLAIGADGAFESAGGPSPEQKKGWLRDKVKDIFDELLSPIDGVLDATVGTPPPEFFGIARDSMEGSRDSAIDWFFDKIEGLGELLGSAYDTAKGLGSAIVGGAKDAAGAVWDNTLGRFLADGGYTGVSENHVAQIARGGAWRVWAEDETGGEAYIPLASGKRARSTEILGQVAGMFGYDLVDQNGAGYEVKGLDVSVPGTHFADGGVRTADEMLRFAKGEEVAGVKASRSLQGAPYIYGGSDWGDCSSAMSALAAFMIGDSDPMPRKFSTADEGAWLTSHGFSSGRGGTGALTIGWNGEHTSGMLPDGTLVEMSNPDDGGFIGSGAQSLDAAGYTDFAHIAAKTAEALTTAADATTTAATATTATGDTSRPKTIAGRVGDAAEETANGVLDFFGIKGTWMDDPSQLGIEMEASTTADAMSDTAVATETADMTSTVPTANAETAAPVEVKPSTDWGQAYFAFQIAKQAKDMSLGASGAKIGVATSLVETGDPMKMYANNAVPESLNYRHDAVGSDGTSVGLFQQTEGNGWGTVADRMDAYKSAGMFYDVMLDFFPDWKTMDPGSVAQGVQRSAYPDRYSTQMSRAQQLVDQTGLFDQGGVLDHKRFALNLSGKPEAILTNEQWEGLANIATTAAEASTGPVGVTDPAVGGPSGVDTTGPVSSRSGAAGQDGMVVNLNIDKVETQDPEAASRELMREARRVLAQFV
ncbi:MAG: phage tail protein [Corynebacterium variabile]|uniref:phage tail protein n=1 Tax=Corynebacterium variabile TaxID=1727 RepID=UPI003F901A87